jgi:hypothetical protein
MDNLGMMEINEIRFLNQALDRLRTLSAVKYSREDEAALESNGEFGSVESVWED